MSPDVPCPSCGAPLAPDVDRCQGCGATVVLVGAGAPTPAAWGRRDAARSRRDGAGPASAAPGARGGAGAPADQAPGRRSTTLRTGGTGLGPAFDGAEPAAVGRRLVAVTLDLALVTGAASVAWVLSSSVLLAAVVAVEAGVALVLWEARSGRTVGNALLGLRTAKVETPWAPGLGRAGGRALLVAASVPTVVGPWVLVGTSAGDGTRRGQGWHDRAARCVVVDVRAMRVDGSAVPPVPAADGWAARGPVAGDRALPGPSAEDAGTAAASVGDPRPPAAPVVPSTAEPVPQVAAVVPSTAERVPQAAAVVPPAATYVVVVDSGEAMSVTGPGLIGRRPQPRDGELCDHVIALEDASRTLSRTHARFGVDGSGFWIEDGGSANGTAVVAPDGSRVDLAQGERAVVPDGGTVRLGSRTITVRRHR